MKGLLRKDYYMLFRNCRMLLLVIFIFLPLSALQEGGAFLIFYPALLISLLPSTLLAYDERDHWDSYCMTLPCTKSQLVASKYLLGLLNSSVVILLSMLVCLLRMSLTASFSTTELYTTFCLQAIISCLAPAFVLPFMFRYGTEKGRLVYYVVVVLFCMVTYGSPDILSKTDIILSKGFFGLVTIAAFVIYGLSCLLSIRLYQKREIA